MAQLHGILRFSSRPTDPCYKILMCLLNYLVLWTDKQMVCYNNQSKTSHYATFSIHFSDEIPKVTISFHNNLYSWNHCKEITLNNCPKPGTAIEVLLKLGILLSFLDFWLAALPSEVKQSKALVLLGYPSEFSSIEINAFTLLSSSRF